MDTQTTSAATLTINGQEWANGRKEMIRSVFHPVGYITFSPKTNRAMFCRPNGDPIACLAKRRHDLIFTSVTKVNGKLYYMYAMSDTHARMFGTHGMGLFDTERFAEALYDQIATLHTQALVREADGLIAKATGETL